MRDELGAARQRLAREIDSNWILPTKPIAADPWVVSSLLQKSIRRGETEIARCAALTLFKHRGSSVWRRLMVIAFEDVGIGSLDVVDDRRRCRRQRLAQEPRRRSEARGPFGRAIG